MRPALHRSITPSTPLPLPAALHALARDLSHGLTENEHFNFWADIHALSRGRDKEHVADRVLSLYLGDALFGLANATQIAGLQELAHGLSHLYAARALGLPPQRGLENLLPVLLMEAGIELRERHATRQERLVLEALRLAWSAPSLGPRGLRAFASASRRALGAGRAMAAGQRALLLQAFSSGS
jgi:hypothetical protein